MTHSWTAAPGLIRGGRRTTKPHTVQEIHMARATASRRRERRILAALPPVRIPARMSDDPQRDPDWCWTCGRKCGSQPH